MHITDIQWDTEADGKTYPPEELGLPTEVIIDDDIEPDDIADYLSDNYGFCVIAFCIEP